ncbi:hypothetical protein AYO44_00105 [Planctomycetaceae bacterium SCGC AG-212-F19]|nr:hypothetical protein AYO44_00105 [Planctomycetaceae bacterium SCGC AG-212-F19]
MAAVEVAERFADNLAAFHDLESSFRAADQVASDQWRTQERGREAAIAAVLPAIACDNDGANIAYDVYQHLLELTPEPNRSLRHAWARRVICCIFGSLPYRSVAVDPAWRTGNVVALAQTIYDERPFDRMPILADALEDAGCTSADVLDHCRQPGEHVRGCWVVDLLLGKA